MHDKLERERLSFDDLFAGGDGGIHRVPGTAVFMSRVSNSVPTALLHNIKHNKVLYERTLILAVRTRDMPYVDDASRVQIGELGHGVFELDVSYGFAGTMDLPRALRTSGCLKDFDPHNTS